MQPNEDRRRNRSGWIGRFPFDLHRCIASAGRGSRGRAPPIRGVADTLRRACRQNSARRFTSRAGGGAAAAQGCRVDICIMFSICSLYPAGIITLTKQDTTSSSGPSPATGAGAPGQQSVAAVATACVMEHSSWPLTGQGAPVTVRLALAKDLGDLNWSPPAPWASGRRNGTETWCTIVVRRLQPFFGVEEITQAPNHHGLLVLDR